jgi:glycosyltransferase involved in cell wall biosynthesis
MKKELVSVIIATFNSAARLPTVLTSVQTQTYPSVEVLVVDGGSTDETRKIARKFGYKVFNNPKKVPLWAKHIGFMHAKGKYTVFLDSDEVIQNPNSIEKKVSVFAQNPGVHAVTGSGYKNPEGMIFLNQYINEFGDPFSFFYYRLSKDDRFFIRSMNCRYHVVKDDHDYKLYDLSGTNEIPLLEFGAMGGVVDAAYLKQHIPDISVNPSRITHVINTLVTSGSLIGITKRDALIHYSAGTYGTYIRKIVSRVVNNIYTPADEGFVGRAALSRGLSRFKKYLFLPYALTLIGPVVDSIYLSVTRKHIGYLIHIPLSVFTAILILYYSLLKAWGFKVTLKSYGEAAPVGDKL